MGITMSIKLQSFDLTNLVNISSAWIRITDRFHAYDEEKNILYGYLRWQQWQAWQKETLNDIIKGILLCIYESIVERKVRFCWGFLMAAKANFYEQYHNSP